MFFLCLFVAPVVIGALMFIVWAGMQLRIRGEVARFETDEAVLTVAQLRTLNATASSVAAIGGLLGIGPAVVVAFIVIQERQLDEFVMYAIAPPLLSGVVGGVLFAAGLVAYAVNSGVIDELDSEAS